VAQELAEVPVEAEARVLAAGDVEDGEDVLVPAAPEAAPELLDEDRRALGGTEQEEGVDVGDVHALVEKIDDAEHLDPSAGEVPLGPVALLPRRVVSQGPGSEALAREPLRDDASVRLVHAEGQRTNRLGPSDALADGSADGMDPQLLGVDEPPGQVRVDVAAIPPGVGEIEPLHVEHEVPERDQDLLLDGVPDAQVADVGTGEVALVDAAVSSLRRGGETDQLLRL
jgi:hypothetical protein